jgi:gephyrin
MSTGDELHDLRDTETGNDGWRSWDTNRPTLRTALEGLGYTVFDLGIVKDRLVALIDV